MNRLFGGKKKFLTIPIAILLGLMFLPITILLLIGWFIYIKVSNKKVKIAGLTVIGLFILFFGTAYISAIVNPSPPKEKQVKSQTTPSPQVIGEQTEATTTPSSSLQQAKVVRVIDGDTIEIEGGQRVRYIGIDTAESGGCFATESTSKNKELVGGKTIRLEKDVSEADRYGRLLRYVYVGDILINEVLVKEGYAQVYTYPPDVKYNERFLAAQKEARESDRGLWSSCQTTPTPTLRPTNIPTQTISTPKPTTPQSSGGGSCKYSCSSPDRDCSDFSTQAEAQTFFNCCGFTATYDPMKLDSVGVGDGVACESLP